MKLPRLNIVTPVSRPGNLTAILENLGALEGMEIHWFTIFDPHYAEAVGRWREDVQRIQAGWSETPGKQRFPVQAAVAGEHKYGGGLQRSYAISMIEEGWCYFLDDDNWMHPNFPAAFRRGLQESPGARVIVFHQAFKDGGMRLEAAPEKMKPCHFDTGQFVMERVFMGKAEYAPTDNPWSTIWPNTGMNDWNFIKKFWDCAPEKFHFVPEIATFYNALR